MPLTIKSAVINYKDPDTGDYVEVNAVGGAASVTDVQVNGTSVLSNGVANIPIADASNPGVIAVNSGAYGIILNSTNKDIRIGQASESQVKAGTNQYTPIAPYRQHQSTFYGLAKASGDTTQSASSNVVGNYTPEAKAKIWEMLGLDGSAFVKNDWKLIREDTGTNATEADVVITTDSNGQPLALTDIRIMFWLPTQETQASVGDFGRIRAYFDTTSNDIVYIGAWTQNANQTGRMGTGEIIQENGIITRSYTQNATIGSNMSINANGNNSLGSSTRWQISPVKTYNKITIGAVTGKWNYILLGKRKSTALDSPVINVSGTTPSISALPGHRYTCGECSTLSILAPASGCIDVTFTSGSTPTVLTVTSAKSNTTVKWANGFDPTSLEADTVYEVNVLDGEFGVVGTWT